MVENWNLIILLCRITFIFPSYLILESGFEFELLGDVDKTIPCAVKLYGTTSYGIMCVDPLRSVGTVVQN